MLRADVEFRGVGLAAKDFGCLLKQDSSDPYLKIIQDGTVRCQTETCYGTLNPQWHRCRLKLVPQMEVFVQCWDWDKFSGDDLIGEARLSAEEMLTEGYEIQLVSNEGNAGIIRVNNVSKIKDQEGSIVSMLQQETFFKEGDSEDKSHDGQFSVVRVYVFRIHYLEQRLGVRYSTVDGQGSAIPGIC